MEQLKIYLSKRDIIRLLKYCNQCLDTLDFRKILQEIDIELYDVNSIKKSLKSLERNLAIIKNDIKMFQILKKTLEEKLENGKK